MSRFWRHFMSDGLSGRIERRLGLVPAWVSDPFEESRRAFPGVPIARVIRRGPADDAGLLEGDLLVRLDGRWVPRASDLHRSIERRPGGTPIPVVVLRRGRFLERWLVLREHEQRVSRRR